MNRYAIIMVGLAGLLVSPLAARAQAPAPASAPTQAPSVVDAIRQSYNVVKNNLLKAADKMPDDGYDFKPTPDVRSFGGWIAHVADAQTGAFFTCNVDRECVAVPKNSCCADRRLLARARHSEDSQRRIENHQG